MQLAQQDMTSETKARVVSDEWGKIFHDMALGGFADPEHPDNGTGVALRTLERYDADPFVYDERKGPFFGERFCQGCGRRWNRTSCRRNGGSLCLSCRQSFYQRMGKKK